VSERGNFEWMSVKEKGKCEGVKTPRTGLGEGLIYLVTLPDDIKGKEKEKV
jgi:hypothetical protein